MTKEATQFSSRKADPVIKSTPSWNVEIHMAGDIAHAANVIQRLAIDDGLSVSLAEQIFIYTGGREAGFKVGFINYPRFETKHLPHITDRAWSVALLLLEELGQHSFSIVAPDQTIWYSRRGVVE